MIDLHAHYPMHVVPDGDKLSLFRLLWARGGLSRLRAIVRALLVNLASLFLNYRTVLSGPRVRMKYLREGEVSVALSVLYSFFDELDVLDGARPKPPYLARLEGQLKDVTDYVTERHPDDAVIARNPRDLKQARDDEKIALIHCVEGGFHLGADPGSVDAAVRKLAGLGVVYITLAHLIWREVGTNAPALPFLSEEGYRRWFPQPDEGLSELGEAAVRAMVRERVLIDVSHMSELALDDTFALLKDLDPPGDAPIPVIASHAGYRLGEQEYMLPPKRLKQIAARGGVVGLIFAEHQLADGLPARQRAALRLPGETSRRRFKRSFRVLCRHIDGIRDATGSHAFTAIGSDLDGFIKPTLPGLDDMRDMKRLKAALLKRYGEDDAERISSGNALRLLESYWRGAP